ncbi:uncharacterized protein LOC110981560 isoform X2 [Acanthaster planci]|uniref:Uncharacterized protein LOC110981560 isoform X2 n=1 Tax=Acanthaster planci TaxID=133434 RepID=A0A8B7YNN2_ACAPL|nr:uncharacterized protein LOC110981560 isoform X2 [Acanthaster planci]XP_022094883.1 uncharacterized protein LOC110981560 isoform X2 [Acanthaster planci]XP_022094884.1 uncharacterized protein LOC110981560 isoform X2 [Acanthaster planci]
MDRYRRANMRFRANTLPEEIMSRRNREYKDVVQKLVGRQTNAARGSPDQQRRLQQRHMLQQLRQHVSEARYETGEAVSHIQEEMYKLEARFSQPGSLDSDEGITMPQATGNHASVSPCNSAAASSTPDKYQSDTLRAMQDLILKRRESEKDDSDPHEAGDEAMKMDRGLVHSSKDSHMT